MTETPTIRMPLSSLPPWDDDGHLRALVETPRGSTVKLAYEPTTGTFLYKRSLPLGMTYPYDWGFVPGTRAPDGDPLDVLVVHDAATYPGVVIPCRLLGVLRLTEKGKRGRERNDRVLVAPVDDVAADDAHTLRPPVRKALEQFFTSVVLFADKDVRLEGWGGVREAARLVKAAERAFPRERR